MKLRLAAAAAVLLCLPLLTLAQGAGAAEEAAIRQVVQHYFDGLREDDPEKLKKAMHPKGEWFFASAADDLMGVRHKRVFVNVKENARHAGPPFKVTSRVVSVDVAGRAASVKVEFDYPDAYLGSERVDLRTIAPGVRQTDYLSLIKFADGWKIVSKVSSSERLPPAGAGRQSASK